MKIAHCIPLMILLASLLGCEATTFQKPPLAEASCDTQLVGDWLTVPDAGTSDAPGEGELQIDKTCQLIVIDHKQDKTHADQANASDPTQLHVGHDGTHGYIWVDSAWAFGFARSDLKPPTGDVTVLRYGISGDDLSLSLTDDRAIAHHLIDGNLKGDVRKIDNTVLNRITGTLALGQLRDQIVFSDKPAHFVRHAAESVK
ncbi:MAG: hypothetical protein ABI365_05165 [Lysobacteraceae bacterium]